MSCFELEELEALSAQIAAEESAYLSGSSVGPYALLFLHIRRIHRCLPLIALGYSGCTAHIREDWEELTGYFRRLLPEGSPSGKACSHTADLILLLDPCARPQLLQQLDTVTRLKLLDQSPLPSEVSDTAYKITEACLDREWTTEACSLMENLTLLSQERNAEAPELHRETVLRALWYCVDVDPECTCRIGDRHIGYFEGFDDYSARRFLWFYGYALAVGNRVEESIGICRRCWELCLLREGDTSWTGARAAQLYHFSRLSGEDAPQAEAFLWDLIQKIDAGFYSNMDSTSEFVRWYTLTVLLGLHMDRQDLRNYLPEVQALLEYCYTTSIPNPRLTIRYGENMLAAYYLEVCDYLQAADHVQKALDAPVPPGVEPTPSDVLLYSNQLMIYCVLNDAAQMLRLCQLLLDEYEAYEDNTYTTSRVLTLINTAARKLGLTEQDVEDSREALADVYEQILEGTLLPDDSPLTNTTYALWVLDMAGMVMDSGLFNREELVRLRTIITFFTDRPDIYALNTIRKSTSYLFLAQVQWLLDDPEAVVSLGRSLEYSTAIPPTNEARISILRFAAVVYHNYGYRDYSLALAREALGFITQAWHKAVAYLNDHKICRLLSQIQFDFHICYSLMRLFLDSRPLYDTLLRFKALSALVGRERNRLLRRTAIDEGLQRDIFTLQDRLAAAELNDSLLGTDTVQEVYVQLQRLEAEFSSSFPQNLRFTEISLDRLCRRLPENSAILEYWFAMGADGLSKDAENDGHLELDIFVTANRQGHTDLVHLKCGSATQLIRDARRFVELLQEPASGVLYGDEKEQLRASLYRALIVPALPHLEGIGTLYIAPDDLLFNLPFEILREEGSPMLQDGFQLCRLVCGRDLLFYDDAPSPAKSAFVLGGPDYEAEQGDRSDSLCRDASIHLTPVAPLPFSGVEATGVARRCRTHPLTGPAATKYALSQALPCRIIHLATHGVFDADMETDSLYSSHLVFAGYNKWVREGTESALCGNGVLTADEISRMDLRETELVVLSACQSGLGDTSYGSTQGLLSAFSAAGVRWIISHMWKASDLATPVLMDAFYHAHLDLGLEVPEALQHAKHRLRTVTVGELRRQGWLNIPEGSSRETADTILALSRSSDRRRPFTDEFYWGGFTVHKSK